MNKVYNGISKTH